MARPKPNQPPMAGHRAQKVQIEGTATVSGAVTATNLDIRVNFYEHTDIA